MKNCDRLVAILLSVGLNAMLREWLENGISSKLHVFYETQLSLFCCWVLT